MILQMRDSFSKAAGVRVAAVLFLAAICLLEAGCVTVKSNEFSRFIGVDNFSQFTRSENGNGETLLLSPVIQAGMDWNELILSWNATVTSGTFLKVEASAVSPDHSTPFYSWGVWAPDRQSFTRSSAGLQKGPDGQMDTDTLVLSHPANAVRLRVTLVGTNGELPRLQFLGLSFCNTKAVPVSSPPNRGAWGKTIPTPERSQHGYPSQEGWCSPAALCMELAYWSAVLHRPEMNLDVPEVAAAIYDKNWHGTGNWPFNTAFAGSFQDMHAYVTRFSDISELEDWVAAGIPVIISAPWHLLKPGRSDTGAGHIVVCIGFTENGDVVINDPAGSLQKGTVRQIYRREDVIRAWAVSHNVVYLVYPASAKIPKEFFKHWETDSPGK